MLIRFLLQVAGFTLFYSLIMLATLPFLVYFGKPKPWQKAIQFLMSFPFDNEKLGLFSFTGGAAVVLLNGVIWGIVVTGTGRLIGLAIRIL